MQKILFIIDAQNDFCSKGGSLCCYNAENTVRHICELLNNEKFDKVVCTLDTHNDEYIDTREGKLLPVKHCIYNTFGYELNKDISKALEKHNHVFIKKTAFMAEFVDVIDEIDDVVTNEYDIYVCGFATDICVLNNALLLNSTVGKWFDVHVIKNCCAGTSADMHDKAIELMRNNLVDII